MSNTTILYIIMNTK